MSAACVVAPENLDENDGGSDSGGSSAGGFGFDDEESQLNKVKEVAASKWGIPADKIYSTPERALAEAVLCLEADSGLVIQQVTRQRIARNGTCGREESDPLLDRVVGMTAADVSAALSCMVEAMEDAEAVFFMQNLIQALPAAGAERAGLSRSITTMEAMSKSPVMRQKTMTMGSLGKYVSGASSENGSTHQYALNLGRYMATDGDGDAISEQSASTGREHYGSGGKEDVFRKVDALESDGRAGRYRATNDDKGEASYDLDEFYWTKRFASIVDEKASMSTEQYFIEMGALASEFNQVSELYSRVLVAERLLPFLSRSIMPIDAGGVAGGDKFICAGIFFKWATAQGLFDGKPDLASRSARHDLRSLNAVIALDQDGIRLPLACVLNIKGVCILAMARLPIGKHSLVYGSHDAGRTIHNSDPEADALCQSIATQLNLRTHRCGDVDMALCGDAEIHRSRLDNSLYALDLARLFPCEPPQSVAEMLAFRLRPELTRRAKLPLSSDVFSSWDDSPPDERQAMNNDVKDAMRLMLGPEGLGWVARELNKQSGEDYPNYSAILHSRGLNMRLLGMVKAQLTEPGPLRMISTEMSARVLGHMLFGCLRSGSRRYHCGGLVLDSADKKITKVFLNAVFCQRGRGPIGEALWSQVKTDIYKKYYENAPSMPPPDGDGAGAPHRRWSFLAKGRASQAILDGEMLSLTIMEDQSDPRDYIDWGLLLERLCDLTGTTFNGTVSARNLHPDDGPEIQLVPHEALIRTCGVVIHGLDIASIGSAFVGFKQAKDCPDQTLKEEYLSQAERYLRAVSAHFKNAEVEMLLPRVLLHKINAILERTSTPLTKRDLLKCVQQLEEVGFYTNERVNNRAATSGRVSLTRDDPMQLLCAEEERSWSLLGAKYYDVVGYDDDWTAIEKRLHERQSELRELSRNANDGEPGASTDGPAMNTGPGGDASASNSDGDDGSMDKSTFLTNAHQYHIDLLRCQGSVLDPSAKMTALMTKAKKQRLVSTLDPDEFMGAMADLSMVFYAGSSSVLDAGPWAGIVARYRDASTRLKSELGEMRWIGDDGTRTKLTQLSLGCLIFSIMVCDFKAADTHLLVAADTVVGHSSWTSHTFLFQTVLTSMGLVAIANSSGVGTFLAHISSTALKFAPPGRHPFFETVATAASSFARASSVEEVMESLEKVKAGARQQKGLAYMGAVRALVKLRAWDDAMGVLNRGLDMLNHEGRSAFLRADLLTLKSYIVMMTFRDSALPEAHGAGVSTMRTGAARRAIPVAQDALKCALEGGLLLSELRARTQIVEAMRWAGDAKGARVQCGSLVTVLKTIDASSRHSSLTAMFIRDDVDAAANVVGLVATPPGVARGDILRGLGDDTPQAC